MLLFLWDIKTSKKTRTLKGNFEQISALKFSHNQESLDVAGKSATLKYWELQSNQFYTTSLSLEESKRSRGWKNTIVEIDSADSRHVYITYVEYLPQHNTSIVSKAVFFQGVWDVVGNVVTLKEINRLNYRKTETRGIFFNELFTTERKKMRSAAFDAQLNTIILNYPGLKNFSD